jgi:beta-lactamase regulating signal transducer with metallopeptidase domain
MMAPDRSNESEGGQYPSRESLEQLRKALSGYIADQNETPVCDALAVLAREAQERKLYAERMLVAFKRVWGEMPEVKAMATEKDRQRLLDRLVRLCIDAYYTR